MCTKPTKTGDERNPHDPAQLLVSTWAARILLRREPAMFDDRHADDHIDLETLDAGAEPEAEEPVAGVVDQRRERRGFHHPVLVGDAAAQPNVVRQCVFGADAVTERRAGRADGPGVQSRAIAIAKLALLELRIVGPARLRGE